ncbi:MAG: carbon storage regulator CsrA [Candidatus Magasanikbacteria bacterium]|nr:carbon storage regulator CsrA [Candidatus Magasanikbacteria bacterium]
MLTLTRKSGECIRIGDDVRIVVREVRGRQVRIGVEAPGNVPVHREEVWLRVRNENLQAAGSGAPDIEALAALVQAERQKARPQKSGGAFVPARVIHRDPRRRPEPESGVAPPA